MLPPSPPRFATRSAPPVPSDDDPARLGPHALVGRRGPVVLEVERILGAPVVSAISQPGGFSPGSADRVRAGNGARAFVKAADARLEPAAAAIHRREIDVLGSLPESLPTPRLLGAVDDGPWVALIIDDVEGRHPRVDESHLVLEALKGMPSGDRVPSGLARADKELVGTFSSWARLDDATGFVDASEREALAALAEGALAAVAGDTLVQLDLRADNVLIDRDGRVSIVDWPWALVGCRFLDGLTMLLDTRVRDPWFDSDALLAASALFDGVPARDIDAILAALTGLFLDSSRQPEPRSLAGLRVFQRREADACRDWLRARGALA